MKKANVLKSIVMTCLMIVSSCQNDDQVDPDALMVELEVLRSFCIADNSIDLTFQFKSTGGQEPYVYEWINPDTMVEGYPITINLEDNIVLKVNVSDQSGKTTYYEQLVVKDTIDCSDYDLRADLIGNYKCDVHSCYVNTETWVQTCRDTVCSLYVALNQDHSKINIEGLKWGSYSPHVEVDLDTSDFSFENIGQRVNGRFYSDSIYVSTRVSPAGISWAQYIGKRIDQ